MGYVAGKTLESNKYLTEKSGYLEAIAEKRQELKKLRDTHQEQQQDLLDQIEESKREYSNTVAVISSEFNDRMLESEKRSNLYRERLSTSSLECRQAAEQLSRLDRSLTEGRELVRELAEDLKQYKLASKQIMEYLANDRNFLNEHN